MHTLAFRSRLASPSALRALPVARSISSSALRRMTRVYPNTTSAGDAIAGGEDKVVDKAVKSFGRSRVVREREGPTYQHRFLAKPETVSVVSCPFSGGQPKSGTDLGPNALVDHGLLTQLTTLGWKVNYDGPASFDDIPYINPHKPSNAGKGVEDPDIMGMKKPRLVSAVNKRAKELIEGEAKKGRLPLTLGGDHSLAMATISGVKAQYPDACVVWVDAHADINTPETSSSGNIHGMPLSFLLGLNPTTNLEPFSSWLKPCLHPSEIVYIGLRDIDPGEKEILRDLGIKAFGMHDVDRYGIGKVVEMALESVNPMVRRKDGGMGRNKPIHLSFDVDACDPGVAGSTGTPVRGGLTFREAHYICEAIAETGNLVGLDIMEVNPTLGDEKSVTDTVAVGCSLARAALGETLL